MDDGRTLRFNGKLLAEINDLWSEGVIDIHERTFWKEYFLYKTENDNYILYCTSRFRENYEKENYKVFSNEQELIEYVKKKDTRILFILLKKAEILIIIDIE